MLKSVHKKKQICFNYASHLNCININNRTWKIVHFQIYGLLVRVIFPKKFGAQIQKRLIYMSIGKKFQSLYAFELIIYFLAEESFLNMHSDFSWI